MYLFKHLTVLWNENMLSQQNGGFCFYYFNKVFKTSRSKKDTNKDKVRTTDNSQRFFSNTGTSDLR